MAGFQLAIKAFRLAIKARKQTFQLQNAHICYVCLTFCTVCFVYVHIFFYISISVILIVAWSVLLHFHDVVTHFYRAMLCIHGTSHGPVSVCLSVCVCLSQVRALLKRLNVGSHKQHHTIGQGLQFSDDKDLREIRPGSPPTREPNAGGVGQNRRILTNNRLYIENGTRQTHTTTTTTTV